mgnify:CR=1 FL=1
MKQETMKQETIKQESIKEEAAKNGYIEMSLKVLIVDDNNINVFLLKHMLEAKGFSPSVAVNGQEAVDQVSIEDFDIVLMDLQMPVMDGYEAIKSIRENGKISQPRIVAVTAFVGDESRERAISNGADAFVSKPIVQEELYHAMHG